MKSSSSSSSSTPTPFGKTCRALRDSAGITAEDMSLIVGYSKAFISMVECGKTSIPKSYPYKIIRLMQLSTIEATELLVSVAVTSGSLNVSHIKNQNHIETISRLICKIESMVVDDIDVINNLVNQ